MRTPFEDALFTLLYDNPPPRLGHRYSREFWAGYERPGWAPKWVPLGTSAHVAWRAGRALRRRHAEVKEQQERDAAEQRRQQELARKQREQNHSKEKLQ